MPGDSMMTTQEGVRSWKFFDATAVTTTSPPKAEDGVIVSRSEPGGLCRWLR